jgi:hypothetical protein
MKIKYQNEQEEIEVECERVFITQDNVTLIIQESISKDYLFEVTKFHPWPGRIEIQPITTCVIKIK